MLSPPAPLDHHQQALGKIIGGCYVETFLGAGPLGGVFRARDQRNTAYLVVLFSLPYVWEWSVKHHFVRWYLREVEQRFSLAAPLQPCGVVGNSLYWITVERPGLHHLLIWLFQHKVILPISPSEVDTEHPLPSQEGRMERARIRQRWMSKLSIIVELLTLGGASLCGVTASEVVMSSLGNQALTILARIVVGGSLSMIGLRLTHARLRRAR